MAFEAMFAPIQIGKLTIRNRVLSTAHAEVYATDGGMTTERYIRYYEEKAKGGIGLAICGGSSVVAIDSPQEWWSSVNLSTDRIIPHFQNLADAMHKHGAKIMIQITHMGRRSRWDGFNWPTLMSPSGVREPVHRATCKTIEPEEIWRVIGNYASAAGRAKAGGLDGVELSAVHQHMIDQFWSPRVNKRTDEWGGSFENRMRFGLEVLKAVRAEVGPDFCVGIRLCGDEFHPDGLSHEDMKQIAKYYDDTGMLDFIGVVGSGCDTHNTLANVIPNMSYPPEPFLHLAAGIKEVVKSPVLHAQNIKDPNQATRILEGGYVDMVGMTRAHMADPHLIAKIKMGQIDQIKQCVGANYCIDRQYQGLDVLCIQNAATSREYMGVPHIIEKSTGPKRKVVVVGAGPAGMEAARVAAERGHDVTLFEKKTLSVGRSPPRPRHRSATRSPVSLAGSSWNWHGSTSTCAWAWRRMPTPSSTYAPMWWCWRWAGIRSLSRTNTGAQPKAWWSAVGMCSTARWRRARTCWCTTPSVNSPACQWPTFWPTRVARSRSSPTTSSLAWPSAVRRSRPTTAACTPRK